MAIITEDELKSRLENPGNYCSKGRNLDAKNLSDKTRKLIGLASHFESAKSVGEKFNVSPMTAHLAKKSEGVKEEIEVVNDLAVKKLLVTMNAIGENEIRELTTIKAKTSIAKDLATIVDMTREKKDGPVIQATVQVYAPMIRSDREFEVIEINKAS